MCRAIARHNLTIREKAAFARRCDRSDLETIACGYYGTFSFYLFTSDKSKLSRGVLKTCHRAQPLLNSGFRSLFGPGRIERGMFSLSSNTSEEQSGADNFGSANSGSGT
jgi:hypothetical protein